MSKNKSNPQANGADALLQRLNDAASKIISSQTLDETIQVQITPDENMMDIYYQKISSYYNDGEVPFTISEWRQYLLIAFQARIDICHQKKVDKFIRLVMRIPSFIQVHLAQIGFVSDYAFGVQLIPKIEKKAEVDLALVMRVTGVLTKLADDFPTVKGLPSNFEGDLGFMSMALVNDQVVSYREGTMPGIALAAAVCRNNLLGITLQMSTQYGALNDYLDALRRIVFETGGGSR